MQALVSSRPQALSEWLATHRLDAALAAWLHGQGMAPFVFYRLRQDQLQAVVSSDALTQLQHAYYLAAPRAALRTRELITVLQALAAHGVVPVLFKGAVLAHTVYPNYVCRPMSDLDLWLSDAEIEVAVHALTQIGYVQRPRPPPPPRRPPPPAPPPPPPPGGWWTLPCWRGSSRLTGFSWLNGREPGAWLLPPGWP
ncbi:MAG: nucleotidyltransferase family protein [Anaerolineae bacterium]|nr:nucleotidyltransferase family protein [Anaerolineae bacterium]